MFFVVRRFPIDGHRIPFGVLPSKSSSGSPPRELLPPVIYSALNGRSLDSVLFTSHTLLDPVRHRLFGFSTLGCRLGFGEGLYRRLREALRRCIAS